MKKIYIKPTTTVTRLEPATLMAASGNATADLDNGNNGGFTDKTIDVDNGDDESDAKGNSWSNWED